MAVQWHLVFPFTLYYWWFWLVYSDRHSLFFYLLYNFHKPDICIIFYTRKGGRKTMILITVLLPPRSWGSSVLGGSYRYLLIGAVYAWASRFEKKMTRPLNETPDDKQLGVIPAHLLIMDHPAAYGTIWVVMGLRDSEQGQDLNEDGT